MVAEVTYIGPKFTKGAVYQGGHRSTLSEAFASKERNKERLFLPAEKKRRACKLGQRGAQATPIPSSCASKKALSERPEDSTQDLYHPPKDKSQKKAEREGLPTPMFCSNFGGRVPRYRPWYDSGAKATTIVGFRDCIYVVSEYPYSVNLIEAGK
jgi:hypothetical protein